MSRINCLALHREHTEDAGVDAGERGVFDEPMQRFKAERELAERCRSLGTERALVQAHEIVGQIVIWAIAPL